MDGSIPRIQGMGPTQSIRRVPRRGPRNGDAEAFEEHLEDRGPRRDPDSESDLEHADRDVGVREEDEAGGTLDLTA